MPDKESWDVWRQLARLLRRNGYRPQPFDTELAYSFMYPGKYGAYQCDVFVKPELGQVIFYINSPYMVLRKERLAPMKAFLALANRRISSGEFSLDAENHHKIRFKAVLDYRGRVLRDEWILQCIQTSAQLSSEHLPSLGGLMYNNFTPKEALQQVGL